MAVQEEINHKQIALMTKCAKVTGSTLQKLALAYLRHQKNAQSQVSQTGKQSVQSLAGGRLQVNLP